MGAVRTDNKKNLKNFLKNEKKKALKEVLIVYNEPPIQTSGGNIRVYNLVKEICKKCNVTLLFLPRCKNNKDIDTIRRELPLVNVVVGKIFLWDSFKIPINEIIKWWWNRYFILRLKRIFNRQDDLIKRHWQQTYCLRREIRELLKNNAFDVVQIEHLYLADCIRNVDLGPKSKKILDLHNVHGSMVSGRKKRKLKKYEQEISKHFDSVLVCSEKEKEHAKEVGFKSVKIIPNGVDVDYFRFNRSNNLRKLLFVGDLSYYANKEAVLWFIQKIKPFIPQDMKVEIVGKSSNLSEYSNNQICFRGFVEDFREYTKNSIFICPIKSGGGTRLKILMAAATGMPIISTSKGAEGLDFKDKEDILIADTPYDFIMALNSLVKDKNKLQLSKKLRYNARKIVEEKYSWKVVGKNYLEEVLSEKRI